MSSRNLLSPLRGGSGSALPYPILLSAGVCTLVSVFVSAMSIFLHLKNYRQPMLQRMVIRIMVMVPLYGVSSLISLFSLDAAFFIDAIRDIYEAFVIYCFFSLLLGYLGGERSLLIMLHGREPKQTVFPASLFKRELDVSDPYMFLFLKRGILQYVQVKPILAIATLVLKALGKYNDGDLTANSGYLYISIVYNISICLSLYCLAMFWMCVNEDLKPYRPMPKFLCVKGILFFSFWQSIGISVLVATGAIKRLGPYTDSEHISVGLNDTLICFEMPVFAFAHMYAFSHIDYINPKLMYAARMPIFYAIRDAFGLKDLVEDTKTTFRGEGIDYREFEPAEGLIHQGSGRDRRIRAGLRYAQGGQKKYWLPMPADVTEARGDRTGIVHNVAQRLTNSERDDEVYAPLLDDQAVNVVHDSHNGYHEKAVVDRKGFELPFGDPDEEEEMLYESSKNYLFGDYHYPCIDASTEYARRKMWEEEERVLRDERGALSIRPQVQSYGTIQASSGQHSKGKARDEAGQVYAGSPRMINKDDDRVPDTDVNNPGVRLTWTKYDQPSSSTAPRLSPHIRHANLAPRLATPVSSRSSTPKAPPQLTPPQIRQRASDRERADAVDLITPSPEVEAREASGQERGSASWKGRTYTGTKGVENREVQVRAVRQANVGDVGYANDRDQEPIANTSEVSVAGISAERPTIARSTTPPFHAQINSSGSGLRLHDYSISDENPWA